MKSEPRKRKTIRTLFLVLFPFLFLQFMYGIIVREPYPSMIMPGFSGVKGDAVIMTTLQRTFYVTSNNGRIDTIHMKDMFKGMSNVGSGRLLDRILYPENQISEEHRTRKRADELVERVFGKKAIDYVYKERYPIVDPIDRTSYERWLLKRSESLVNGDVKEMKIVRQDVTRNLSTKEILDVQERDTYILTQ